MTWTWLITGLENAGLEYKYNKSFLIIFALSKRKNKHAKEFLQIWIYLFNYINFLFYNLQVYKSFIIWFPQPFPKRKQGLFSTEKGLFYNWTHEVQWQLIGAGGAEHLYQPFSKYYISILYSYVISNIIFSKYLHNVLIHNYMHFKLPRNTNCFFCN